jgi:hypothetical protein
MLYILTFVFAIKETILSATKNLCFQKKIFLYALKQQIHVNFHENFGNVFNVRYCEVNK